MNHHELEALRAEIDRVDRDIARLIESRMELVSRVADYKRQNKKEILDTDREKKVLENVLSAVRNQDYRESVKAIFENMMSVSKEFQKGRLQDIALPKRFAVIGEHLSHSLSPIIHKLFFEKTGLTGTYDLMEVPPKDLPDLLERLYHEGYSGINVTIPYKTDIMRSLDSLSEEAKRVGAVNTVRIGKACAGYNTDYFGFGKALEVNDFNPKGKSCAVLGSGGSSRAVVSWLEDQGAARIAIVTRDTDAASLKYPGLQSIDINKFNAAGFDLLVNTTPVGMSPKTGISPITEDQLEGAGFVLDLIYNPQETLLLSFARKAKIPYANGLYMLVAQAVCAQEIWQCRSFERSVIDSIYEDIKAL